MFFSGDSSFNGLEANPVFDSNNNKIGCTKNIKKGHLFEFDYEVINGHPELIRKREISTDQIGEKQIIQWNIVQGEEIFDRMWCE